jgi:hypothetical protein
MRKASLFMMLGAFLALSGLSSSPAAPAPVAQMTGTVHFSMEYTLDRQTDGALCVDFRDIKGFTAVCLECVSDDRSTAKVLSRLGLTPASGMDASAPPRMTVILPESISANPAVVLRFRNGVDGPVIFYLKFDPASTPRRGRLYLGNVRDDALIMSAPACPPLCWLAQVVQPENPPCIASKCCKDGGVTYDLTLCTITCHNGDCE